MWILRFAMIFAGCAPLAATLMAPPNLAKQVESADTIVVAKLVRGTTYASGDRVSNDFMLHVDRVLKGNSIPGAEIAAHSEGRGLWIVNPPKQTSIEPLYGIWFLSSATNPYRAIPRSESIGELHFLPVILPEKATPAESGSTPESSVANQILSALRWLADQKSSSEFESLARDFQTLSQAATLPLCRQIAVDQSPRLRAVGIQGLIEANQPDGVTLAADWTDPAALLVPAIAAALMSYSNEDPSGVRALGVLARREPAVQESVAYALRAIHTKETLPALAALLDSNDPQIRDRALSGFCLFVRNAPTVTPQSVPSMSWLQTRQPAPFLTEDAQRYCHLGGTVYASGNDVAQYVIFWKSWWSAHEGEIGQ